MRRNGRRRGGGEMRKVKWAGREKCRTKGQENSITYSTLQNSVCVLPSAVNVHMYNKQQCEPTVPSRNHMCTARHS